MRTFEEYLQYQFSNENPQVLDDNQSDAFDTWVQLVEQEQMFRLATQYGQLKFKEGRDFGLEKGISLIQDTVKLIKGWKQ